MVFSSICIAGGVAMGPSLHAAASRELAARDPVLAALLETHGPMRVRAKPPVDRRFEALARAVAYQQLAGRAAQAIWGRTRALVDGPFDAEAVLALPEADLRGAGLSGSKVAAIRDLAAHVDRGDIRLDRVGRMSDDDVVAMLVQARGIGPWTAHMFLMFDLHRLDVWPTGDYGVRVGYGRAWNLDEVPTARELEPFGEAFRPYRSVAAWYCWRAVDTVTPA
jgi:3-methyladenine DNA glycosylase/8-oxoguanine DNA glycosylase